MKLRQSPFAPSILFEAGGSPLLEIDGKSESDSVFSNEFYRPSVTYFVMKRSCSKAVVYFHILVASVSFSKCVEQINKRSANFVGK